MPNLRAPSTTDPAAPPQPRRRRGIRGVIQRFLGANRDASRSVARVLPQASWSIGERYNDVVAAEMRPGSLVVDFGGGRRCSYAGRRPPGADVRIVAVDISEDAMAGNDDVDERRVADLQRDGLPFADGEVDVITSRSVLEHLDDVERFAAESKRVLKPGGRSIHLIPGRFSIFALINQMLPNWLSRKILFALRPAMIGIGGFPAFYDQCSFGEMQTLFTKYSFDVQITAGFFGSEYFEFLLPLFILVSAYEAFCATLKLNKTAARLLIVGTKPPAADDLVRQPPGIDERSIATRSDLTDMIPVPNLDHAPAR